MKHLLTKYNSCDTFSLTCPYNEGYSIEYPYGKYKLDKVLGKQALANLEEHFKNNLLDRYNAFKNEINDLPDFETLYNEIKEETREYQKNWTKDKSPFISDTVYKKETKYHTPEQFYWHFYHDICHLQVFNESLEAMYKNNEERALDVEFDDEKYKVLKPYIKDIEVTFVWHCTVSGQLSKVFYIELNETTKEWLNQFESPFDIEGLEDLALYKNNELKYSCCTHEEFDNEY